MTGGDAIAWVPRPAILPPSSEGALVVEASAGTGKTFFIEHRVADLMIEQGADLEQILLVTFTEKATAELRARVRGLLDRLVHAPVGVRPDGPAWRIDAGTRAHLQRALWSMERAAISTIHGFCQRTLGDEALVGRRLLDERQISEEVAFDEAWHALLREQFARDPDDARYLAAYLGGGRKLDELRKTLLSALRKGGELAPPLRAAAPVAAVEALAAQLAAIDDPEAFVRSADGRAGSVDKAAETIRILRRRLAAAESPLERVLVFDAALELDDRLAKLPGALTPKKKGFASREATALAEGMRALLPQLQRLPLQIAHRFLPALRARLDDDKLARGQFDYQDLLARLAALLRGPGGDGLATRLRARLPWALIDEFQDTDPLQWEIFERVWRAEPAVGPARGGLTIVGDPKQAIYSFRGADVATYLRAREAMLASGARRIELTANQRSTRPLVEATNALLAGPAVGLDFFTGAIGYDAPVAAAGRVDAAPAVPAIVVWDAAALAEQGKGAARDAYVAAIAVELATLTRGPDALTLRHGEQALRPLRLDDVLVLTRSNAESRAVAAGLRARGVPCALLLAEYLLNTDEARAVADLLAALAAPTDRSARLRAWRTPFFSLSWAEARAALDVPEHHPLVARLQAWVELARRRDFPRLFHTLISDSGLATRALGLGAGARCLVNVRHVLELLLEELDRSPIDVTELERRLRRWIAEGEQGRLDDSDVQRAETDEPAVRIMTTHRAKGLEAGVVFVFGGTGQPPSMDPVVTIADATATRRSQLRSSLKEDASDRDAFERACTHEDERLGYVALTRAKVRTYLPWHDEVHPRSAYAPIQRALDHWLRSPVGAAQPTLPASIVVRPLPQAAAPTPLEAQAIAAAIAWPAPASARGVPDVAPAQRGGALLSYSRLSGRDVPDEAIALELAPPRSLDEPELPAIELGPNDLPAGAASGLCVHEVLEHADLEVVRRHLAGGATAAAGLAWRSEPDVAARVQAAMTRHGVAHAAFEAVATMAWRTLTEAPVLDGAAAPTGPLAHATALWRELEFAYPLPPAHGDAAAAGSLVRGVLDALVVWDDAMWIVDYKTDLLAQADALAARRMVDDRYRTQVALYGLAGQRLRAQWALGAGDGSAPRFAGLLYWFVRDQLVVPVAASPGNLASWRQWLAQQGPR